MCINKIEAMYEKPCINVKLRVKIPVHTHEKIK